MPRSRIEKSTVNAPAAHLRVAARQSSANLVQLVWPDRLPGGALLGEAIRLHSGKEACYTRAALLVCSVLRPLLHAANRDRWTRFLHIAYSLPGSGDP